MNLVLAYILLLLTTATATAQPVRVQSHSTPPTIRLSESLTVTFVAEGPAPLRVELAEMVLAPDTAKGWRSKPLGPAMVEPLGDGERWTQRYRLDPFDVPLGAETPIAFAPVRVNGMALVWPNVLVTVETAWKKAEVRPEDAHTVTGIEELPPRPPTDPAAVGWVLLKAVGAVFLLGLAVGLVRRWRAKPPPPPPAEWALAELNQADKTLAGRALAERVAAVLRSYVEAEHRLPAPRLTTAELASEAAAAAWPADRVIELREILEQCDQSKFAAVPPHAELVPRAKSWVANAITLQS